jgi:hypothetical protein
MPPTAHETVFARADVAGQKDAKEHCLREIVGLVTFSVLWSAHRLLALRTKYGHFDTAEKGSAEHEKHGKYQVLRSLYSQFAFATI